MKKLIFIFFLGIALISCSSDDDTNETNDDDLIDIPIDDPSIIGIWNMVSSCGGIAYDCWYPPNDYTKMVEFKDNLEYIEKINNIIEVESTYLITDTLLIANKAFYKIKFGFEYTTEFSFISDTLSIIRGDYRENYTQILE